MEHVKRLTAALVLLLPMAGHAGLIQANGGVTALTDISQMNGSLFIADHNDGVDNAPIALDAYADQGMTMVTGALSDALAGVTTPGTASQVRYSAGFLSTFPGPIAGGGAADGLVTYWGPVAVFDVAITQFGLTAGRNGTQYLTAWDTAGAMIGQVTWSPSSDASFIGIDTGGINIGMIAYGNDDLWGGATYGIGGATIMSDNWVWAGGAAAVPAPGALVLLGFGMLGLGAARRRRLP